MISRSQLLALAAAAPMAAIPIWASAAGAPLRVGTTLTESYMEPYYGLEQGFFRKNGIDAHITDFLNGASVVQAVAANGVDIGPADVITLALAVARGIPLAAIAGGALYVSRVQTTLLCAAKNGEIRRAKDLVGKTIAVLGLRTITYCSARTYLLANGVDPKTVTFVEMPPAPLVAALQHGTVAAATVPEPFLSTYAPEVPMCQDDLEPVPVENYT